MKHLRSILASIVAIVMVFAMGVPAYAVESDTHTISLVDTDTHTYRVYQVLTGTLAEEGESALGNPAWGADAIQNPGDVNEFIESIKGQDASTVADLVIKKVNTEGTGIGTVSKGKPLSGLATGYYIMVDETDVSGEDNLDTKALHVVQVVNDINGMQVKWESTEVDKIIATDTLGKGDAKDIRGKIDNVSIGDTVNYEITAKIPANANDFNHFYFIINDTLDETLDFVANSIKVYKESVAEANILTENTDYSVKTGVAAGDCTFQVGLINAKSLSGKKIIVTYSAILNKDAKLGTDPNENTTNATYSNNPNHEYGYDNDNPGFPAEVDDDAMGVTPDSVTKTYTTGIKIQKVDENGNALTGATFKLSGDSIEKVVTYNETFNAVPDGGEYYKLKDGTYTKEAPTADGVYMSKAASDATAGYVVDASYDGDDKLVVDNITYRPYAPETDKGKVIYIKHNGNEYLYDSITTKYKKSIEKVISDKVTNVGIEKAVNDEGIVQFDGLGAGDYFIEETVTPDGYNRINKQKVTINFDDENEIWSTVEGSALTYNENTGVFDIDVINKKGIDLPSTGGIGTTIFYIVGGIMVAGAVVFLLTKRRIAGNE